MAEAIHILLIDDSKSDAADIEAFETRARSFGMKVKHCERGNLGLDELTANPFKYRALVLDARCIWDESGSIPNNKFLNRMVLELERLEARLRINYLAVVNTAYMEDFGEDRQMMLRRGGDIFHKSTAAAEDDDAIFKFLKHRIENSDEWKYRDAFSVFEKGYLPNELRPDLVQILRKLNDTANIKDNFNQLRKFIEAVYEGMNGSDDSLIPSEVFNGRGGGVNLDWTWRYLSGLPVDVRDNRGNSTRFQNAALFPPHISKCVKGCEELSSSISHLYPDSVRVYSYRTAANALLETLVWYREFRDSRQ